MHVDERAGDEAVEAERRHVRVGLVVRDGVGEAPADAGGGLFFLVYSFLFFLGCGWGGRGVLFFFFLGGLALFLFVYCRALIS